MLQRRRFVFLAALAAIAVVWLWQARSPRSTSTASSPPPADLAWVGEIRSAAGGPVAAATVTAIAIAGDEAPRIVATATTTSDGGYRLARAADLADGVVLLQVRHAAHAASGRRIDPTQARHDFVLEPRGADLRIVVVDDARRPVAGAQVEIGVEPEHGDADSVVWLALTADASGRALAPSITAGAATIHWHARAPGHGRAVGVHGKPVGGGAIELTAVLTPGVPVVGQVVDETGATVPEVALTLVEHDGPWRADAHSDGDGRFAIADAPPGIAARVTVSGDYVARGGYEAVAVTLPTAAGPALRIEVEPASAIAGVVTDAAGRPIAGATIAAEPLDGRHGSTRTVTSGRDGGFRVAGLRAGTPWTVAVRHAEFAPTFVEEVAAGDDALAVVLVAGGGLAGRVVDGDGAPVAEAEIYVHRTRRDGAAIVGLAEHTTATTGADGRWALAHLSPGEFRVELRPRHRMQYAPLAAALREVVVVEGEVQTVDDLIAERPGALALAVRADRDLAGARGVAMLLPAGRGGAPHRVEVQLGADGEVTLDGVAPGTYRAGLYLPGHGFVTTDSLTVDGGGRARAELAFGARFAVTGTVRKPDGSPAVGALVEGFRLDGGGQSSHGLPGRAPDNWSGDHTRTDERGQFRLAGLTPGRYRVRAVGPDSAAAPVIRDLELSSAADLELALAPAGDLEIQVVDAAGEAAPGKAVVVEADGGRMFSTAVRTDAEGVARVGGLAALTYQITAAVEGQPRLALALPAGTRRTVVLRAQPQGGTP